MPLQHGRSYHDLQQSELRAEEIAEKFGKVFCKECDANDRVKGREE
jgi:hypothetical protein